MKNLSKEKRSQLVLVVLATAGVLAGLYLGLISSQQDSLRALAENRIAAEHKLQQVKQTIEMAEAIEGQVEQAGKRLAQVEAGMATGDLYSWAINTIRQFKLPYKVEIPQFSQIDGPKEVNMLPAFPYKQVNMTISGTALFYDFGKFVADFENQFPYLRVLNLTLEPVSASVASERERLSFKMEVAALVKPATS
jgi:Tfp pilus assembly protein PilO